jgi:hypothetical protein
MSTLSFDEKHAMQKFIVEYYNNRKKTKSQKTKSIDNSDLYDKLDKNILHFGKVSHIKEDIRVIEDSIEKLKLDIISLKNNVLYKYITKDVAVKMFEELKDNLISQNESLKPLYEYYFAHVENIETVYEIEKLEKIYDENYIYYMNKMRIAAISDTKKKDKLISEAVQLSVFLSQMSMDIRKLKYDNIFIEPGAIVYQQIATDKFYRIHSDDKTVSIIPKSDNTKSDNLVDVVKNKAI